MAFVTVVHTRNTSIRCANLIAAYDRKLGWLVCEREKDLRDGDAQHQPITDGFPHM